MPFQPINFRLNQSSPLNELAQGLMRGMQFRQKYDQGERNKTTQDLQDALLKAKTKKFSEDPYSSLKPTGAASDVEGLEWIGRRYGTDSPQYKTTEKLIKNQADKYEHQDEKFQRSLNARNFRNLPVSERNRATSLAVGMGYDPLEAAKLFSEGVTLQNMADAKGVNLADVKPSYALSSAEVKGQRGRNAFIAEIKNLEKNVAEPMALMSRKFAGFSTKEIKTALSGDHELHGKMLAARALQPEFAALRANALNAKVGIEVIKEMERKLLADSKVIEAFVHPKAYRAMNKYVSKWIDEASGAYNKHIKESSEVGRKSKESSPMRGESKQIGRKEGENVPMRFPDGKVKWVPSNLVDEAIKEKKASHL